MFITQQITHLRSKDPKLFEWAQQVERAFNSIAKQVGADPAGIFPTTPNISAVNVTASAGLLSIQIVDNSLVNAPANSRTVTYFVEVATDAGFVNVIHHEAKQAVRNFNIPVGSLTVFVRAYSQLDGSPPSSPVFFGGTTPQSVIAGGSAAPAAQAYQGSGNSKISGQGFGQPVRSPGTVGRSGFQLL